jgi:hypothetical protein
MNRPGGDVREVPEPRPIASEILVGLFRGLVTGLGVGLVGHGITDATKRDQIAIRLSPRMPNASPPSEPCESKAKEQRDRRLGNDPERSACPFLILSRVRIIGIENEIV